MVIENTRFSVLRAGGIQIWHQFGPHKARRYEPSYSQNDHFSCLNHRLSGLICGSEIGVVEAPHYRFGIEKGIDHLRHAVIGVVAEVVAHQPRGAVRTDLDLGNVQALVGDGFVEQVGVLR